MGFHGSNFAISKAVLVALSSSRQRGQRNGSLDLDRNLK